MKETKFSNTILKFKHKWFGELRSLQKLYLSYCNRNIEGAAMGEVIAMSIIPRAKKRRHAETQGREAFKQF